MSRASERIRGMRDRKRRDTWGDVFLISIFKFLHSQSPPPLKSYVEQISLSSRFSHLSSSAASLFSRLSSRFFNRFFKPLLSQPPRVLYCRRYEGHKNKKDWKNLRSAIRNMDGTHDSCF